MSDKFTLKARIQTFQNIESLTYSMQIISIIKLKKLLGLISNSKPLAGSVENIMKMVLSCQQDEPAPVATQEQKHVVLSITSNRGFCGDFNGEVKKLLYNTFDTKAADHLFFMVGKKSNEVFKARNFADNISYHTLISDNHTSADAAEDDVTGEVSLGKIKELVEQIVTLVRNKRVASISLVYNSFESILRQRATSKQLFPLELTKQDRANAEKYIFEPAITADMLTYYLSEYLTALLYLHALESEAGEMGARFIMMKNATDSCKKSVNELTLEMNKIRQAAITKDLSEIVSGFKVLKKERG